MLDPPRLSPGCGPSPGCIGALLGVFVPGAGQMYLGRVGLGVFIFFATLFGCAAYILPGLVIPSIVAAAASVPATPPGPAAKKPAEPPGID